MRQLFTVLFAVMLFSPLSSGARTLTSAQKVEVERVKSYLEGLTTLEAAFQQYDGRGHTATGRFWLHRPNRLRFEYDPPNPILIVARASFLVHYDKELKETYYFDQDETPAWFLLSKKVQFDDNVIIQDVARGGGRLSITARQKDKPDEGAITLVFQDTPIRLLGWSLVDAGGGLTHVALLDQKVGGKIDPDLFQFRPTDYD